MDYIIKFPNGMTIESGNALEAKKKILEKTVSDKNVIKNNLKLIASKGINLSKDYVDLMSNKSAYIVGSYEFNTINGTRTRDSLINETLFYKKQDSNFPKNAYVICNLGIDSAFLIQEPSGKIYTYQYGNKKLKLEANNIGELINVILSEK